MVKTATRSVDLEPIDRLEEKMKLLVGMVDRMKSEQARAAEENQRLSRELESMRSRIASSDGLANELSSLKEERDVIRTRVTDTASFRTLLRQVRETVLGAQEHQELPIERLVALPRFGR